MRKEDPTLYDVRVVKYHLRRGKLTAEQLESRLAELPDDADQAEPSTTRFVATSEGRSSSEPDED